eukprot:jgi/Ulvmu1/9099/UM005_0194.1
MPSGVSVATTRNRNASRRSGSSVTHAVRDAPRARQGRGGGRGSGRKNRGRMFIQSDGESHLGSSQTPKNRQFPGPPPDDGPPLRILPIGGLGEIGMNCMLVGARDRYILIDAGLMFPDFTDYGMQKILPDTSFLAEWRDKIEALVITHGHEDHIGALPWVVPALHPDTPIFAGAFSMQLVQRRLREYTLFDERRFHTFGMRQRFQAGPFEIEPFRVTHSIPDCCGMVLRSEYGNIVHTGDWKIDEAPLDGHAFDRDAFEAAGREGVALLMSDSTNVLSPGRTVGEREVAENLVRKIAEHDGQGRVIATQFASNIHRLGSVKRAADAAGRRVAFLGMSLYTYLEAAQRAGFAPFTVDELVPPEDIDSMDPNKLLVITTGSQGEDRAVLNMASMEASPKLKLLEDDLLVYSAKVIPGNDKRCMKMFNRISNMGIRIANNRADGLHASGHAHQEELREVLKLVQPRHFLPVHGEAAFLYAHAELAQGLGCRNTTVIRNGQMLAVNDIRNREHVSMGTAAVVGEVELDLLFNDGARGTGTAVDMALRERNTLAQDGIVVVAVDVGRAMPGSLTRAREDPAAAIAAAQLMCKVRVTARGMWTDSGTLLKRIHGETIGACEAMPPDVSLPALERKLIGIIRKVCKQFNGRRPEVLVVAHEMDPRAGMLAAAAAGRTPPQGMKESGAKRGARRAPRKIMAPSAVPEGMLEQRRRANPRENPDSDTDLTYG